jgi:hypothetical protein
MPSCRTPVFSGLSGIPAFRSEKVLQVWIRADFGYKLIQWSLGNHYAVVYREGHAVSAPDAMVRTHFRRFSH